MGLAVTLSTQSGTRYCAECLLRRFVTNERATITELVEVWGLTPLHRAINVYIHLGLDKESDTVDVSVRR
jgi:hypothetical protein